MGKVSKGITPILGEDIYPKLGNLYNKQLYSDSSSNSRSLNKSVPSPYLKSPEFTENGTVSRLGE